MEHGASGEPFDKMTSDLFAEAEHILQSNTPEARLERLTLPQPVFTALDTYLRVFARTYHVLTSTLRPLRDQWLYAAADNWHTSPDYLDTIDSPMLPLQAGQHSFRQRLQAMPDIEVARMHAEMARLEWLMAIGRTDSEPNSRRQAPPIISSALDAYFRQLHPQPGDDTYRLPLYPNLHLVSETVLRASLIAYSPSNPHPVYWQRGLPAPVKAALDTLSATVQYD